MAASEALSSARLPRSVTRAAAISVMMSAIQRSKRFQGAEPRARELMDEVVSLLEPSRPS